MRVGRLSLLTVAVVVVAGGGIAAGLLLTSSPVAPHYHAPAHAKLTPAQVAARQAAQTAAAHNASAAAQWVAAQVAPGTVIGCDPAACASILQAGYPSGGQVVLQRGVSLPGPGALILATGTIRGQYRSALATTAPEVVAVFGTGAQAVQVRVAVAGGAQAYQQAARVAQTARQHAGQGLLGRSRVRVTGATRTTIASGGLDPRLTADLGRLAAAHFSVTIVGLSDAGPTPAVTVPYRSAIVVIPSSRVRRHLVSDLGGMEQVLRSQPAGYRPAISTFRGPGGRSLLQLTFPAPSPA